MYEQGLALQYLASIAWYKKSFNEAEQFNQTAKALFEQVGDQLAVSHSWYQLSADYISRGDLDQALHANQEQFRIHEKMGNWRLMGTTLHWESIYAARYGTLEQAWDARQRSQTLAREVGHLNDIAWSTWELGDLYRLMEDIERACHWYQQAFPLFERLEDHNGMGFYYRGLGEIALHLKQWEEARSQFKKSLDVLEKEHRYVRDWSLPYTQAGLGNSLVGLGNFSEARQVLQSSVRNAELCGNWDLMLISLTGFARLYAAIGRFEAAVELATLIANHHASWNETKKQARTVLEISSRDIPEDIVQAAQGRGMTMTIEEASAYVLQDG